jgi:GTPase
MATTSNDINQVNEMVEDLSIDRIAPKAIDYSSIQSKSVLVSPTEEQFELLRRRLADRMLDSRGETIYDIGVGEDASDQGLDQDEYDATCLNAECVKLRQGLAEKGKITGQFLIREKIDEKDFMEIRVAVVGNVDAGKSTLLGVLTHGELDNGRGHARQRLFRHKHEMESGRTSSVGNDILVRTFSFHILMK